MGRARLIACISLLFAGIPASAQVFHRESQQGSHGLTALGIAGQYAQPVGGFRTNVDAAWGVGLGARYHFGPLELLGLRGDFTYLTYGNENKRVPLSPTVNRVLVDMTTSNNIVVASAGPELMLTRGPINPYVYGFGGYSWFFTESSVGDDGDGSAFASSTNFSDGGFATGWGGGVSIPLRMRTALISIDAGVRRTFNGPRTYLKRGDIVDQADGSLQFNARNTDGDFLQYHLGVSLGFRRRR
jgi:hypothetical protein